MPTTRRKKTTRKIYMAVTPDEYEYCLGWADSKVGLSKLLRISETNIYRHLHGEYMNTYDKVLAHKAKYGVRPPVKYFIREVELDESEED